MTTAAPDRPDQLEDDLLNPAKLKELLGSDGKLDPAKLRATSRATRREPQTA